jgi:hypothetical protein
MFEKFNIFRWVTAILLRIVLGAPLFALIGVIAGISVAARAIYIFTNQAVGVMLFWRNVLELKLLHPRKYIPLTPEEIEAAQQQAFKELYNLKKWPR